MENEKFKDVEKELGLASGKEDSLAPEKNPIISEFENEIKTDYKEIKSELKASIVIINDTISTLEDSMENYSKDDKEDAPAKNIERKCDTIVKLMEVKNKTLQKIMDVLKAKKDLLNIKTAGKEESDSEGSGGSQKRKVTPSSLKEMLKDEEDDEVKTF